MRGIYKSLAIAVASLSLLGSPAHALVDATTLNNAIAAGDSVQIDAMLSGADAATLAQIAQALAATGNSSLIAAVALGSNSTSAVTAIGAAVANTGNTTLVATVLTTIQATNPAVANLMGPAMVSANPQMAATVASTGTQTVNTGTGTGTGTNPGSTNKTGTENAAQNTPSHS